MYAGACYILLKKNQACKATAYETSVMITYYNLYNDCI